MKKIVHEIAAKAAAVQGIHREHQAAAGEETAAALDLLEAVREAARPSLDALCSKLPTAFTADVVEDGKPPAEKRLSYGAQRGCVLLDRFGRDSDADGRHGRYFGAKLILVPTGSFALLEREGRWSSIPGDRCGWSTTLRELDATEVLDVFDASEVVAAIHRVLDAQLSGAATRRTDEALARAEKLRAVATLLSPDRTLLPGLRMTIARKLWLAGERTGYSIGDARLDVNEATEAFAAKHGGRVVWHRRHADEVTIVKTGGGEVFAISDVDGAWGVRIGLLDHLGRFQAIGGRSSV